MEIDHSRHIIQELLEILINANSIGLEISEIEGDAILFYKYGEAPDLKTLYSQVEKMFCEFHRQYKSPEELKNWMTWDLSAKKTESGEIPFQYTQLTPLKNEIASEPPLHLEIKERKKIISVSRKYDTDINTLFYAAGHFEFRNRWQEGVKAVDEVSHYLLRMGTKHRYILENGQAIMYTSSFSYGPEKIVYSETDEKKQASTYFIFEKIKDNRTKLTLDFYLKKKPSITSYV